MQWALRSVAGVVLSNAIRGILFLHVLDLHGNKEATETSELEELPTIVYRINLGVEYL
jgi:hypothetical protein